MRIQIRIQETKANDWNPDTNQFISRKKYDFEEVFISCIGIIFCQIYIVDLLLTLTFRLILNLYQLACLEFSFDVDFEAVMTSITTVRSTRISSRN